MIIAVDAMGGDYAPAEIVKGAVEAVGQLDVDIVLVGDAERIEVELQNNNWSGERISVYHASQVIGMDEHPGLALKSKRDASIMVATRLVKEKKADALVSCGNTGAQMGAALFVLGRLEGIERPAIAVEIPGKNGNTILLDVGANVDVKPANLVQFALMGAVYAEIALEKSNPRVALLSNGEEETKGNQVIISAYSLLKDMKNINFIGNVEGRDFFSDKADVVVCDGFVGNVIIKTLEGFAFWLMGRLMKAGIGQAANLFKDLDYTRIGGAPLLGVDGISVVCHGSSNSQAVVNGIAMAQKCVEAGITSRMRDRVKG